MNFYRNEINIIDENSYSDAELLSSSLDYFPFPLIQSLIHPFEDQTTNFMTQDNFSSERTKKTKFITRKNVRGRKRNRENSIEINNADRFIHNKFGADNLLRKIQVHYLSFITQYSNEVLKKFGFKDSFNKMDYKIKKNVNKKNIMKLKKLNIGEILCFNISPKYSTKAKDFNINLYKKAICNPTIKKIFSENYLVLFRNIYYPNERIINLEKYGLNDTLILSKKVKTYESLLLKNDLNIEVDKNDEYFKKLEKCIKKNY